MDPRLDSFFEQATRWKAEMKKLRAILKSSGLEEEFKWGKACYGTDGSNVAIIQPMKEHLALMFFQGALLVDTKGVLQRQGPNSHAARRMCFTSVREVADQEAVLRNFVEQAVRSAKAGLKVEQAPELVLCDELAQRLAKKSALRKAFEALTPGRQREYNLHIAGARQSSTRERRIDACVDGILAGKGLRD